MIRETGDALPLLRNIPRRRACACLAFLLCAASLALRPGPASATPTIDAEVRPAVISPGQEARLTVTISGAANAPTPRIAPVAGLEIQNLGQTMSMEFVNGAMTTEVRHTFVVRARRAGTFRIPPAMVSIAGDELAGPAVSLEVRAATGTGAGRNPPTGDAAERGAPGGNEPTEEGIALLEIRGLPDRRIYVGEVLPIDILLFIREGTRVTEASPPSIEGSSFTLARPSEGEPRQERVRRRDGLYTKLTFPGALSPIKTGELSLRVALDLTARVPKKVPRQRQRFGNPFFDSFFDSFSYRAVEEKVAIRSAPYRVAVAPLPTEGQPPGFSGGIGQFEISASAAPAEVAVGDPITITMVAQGRGNFDRLQLPGVSTSATWKTYPATTEFEPGDSLSLTGRKTFEQAVLPLDANIDEIPARALSFFDPERESYVTVSLPAIPIEVLDSATVRGTAPPRAAAAARLDRTDLAPNKIDLGPLVRDLSPVATRWWFAALPIAPILAAAGALAWGRRRRRQELDPRYRHRRHLRNTLQNLSGSMDAAVAEANATAFFDAARRSLQEALADDEPAVASTSLTARDLQQRLVARPDLRERVRDFFEAADALAYGGQNDARDLERWRAEVAKLLTELDPEGTK